VQNLGYSWMSYRTSSIRSETLKYQLQPSRGHSIALPSHTNLSQKKQLSGINTFMQHGRLPWHSMILSSSSLSMKLVWMTKQICAGMVGHCLACVCHTSFSRGRKYSILPALSVDGIVALDIFEGSVNQEHFLTFLRNHLV
jgi:hypothetical protein